ncbi:NRAMP family divalent metal transporter [Thermocladium modestius]|uniref:NRAMP family divalent metal transporter n=1 Tax=Thermocladium modestius TaxID=62609 RepID=UPI001E2BE871|nr:NRAMP family divalent metal transporter [Thermocladium modestius]
MNLRVDAETIRRQLYVFGPAWLVMMADIDVASIVTGLQSGATWGYRMIFIMIILTIPLFVIQDAAGRLGTVGGKGLGEAIRIRYSGKTAAILSIPMAVSDFLEYVAEYAGISIGIMLLGLPLIPLLLLIYVFHAVVVLSRNYRKAEIIMLPISFVLAASIAASAVLFKPNPSLVLSGLSPLQPYGNPSFDYLLAANIGAVIMPWMLYFHSGADSRKKLKTSDLRAERLETLIGAIASEVLMAMIVIDGIHLRNVNDFLNIDELSHALAPFGSAAPFLLAMGFLAAGFLALVVISMASAWGVLEAVGRTSRRAFLSVYLMESLPALVLVILYSNYVELMLDLMVLYTIIIIPSLYVLGRLVTDPNIMKGLTYKPWESAMYWAMTAVIIIGGIAGLISMI